MKNLAIATVKAAFKFDIEAEVVRAAAEIADIELVSIDTNMVCKVNNLYSSEEGYTDFVVFDEKALVIAEENGYEFEGMIVPVSRVRELQKWESEGYRRLEGGEF